MKKIDNATPYLVNKGGLGNYTGRFKGVGGAFTCAYNYGMTAEEKEYLADRICMLLEMAKGLSNRFIAYKLEVEILKREGKV